MWTVLPAEACSTTEDGDEPLHCPTGYECHIINPGNPTAGIPNRGQCIKQRGNSGMAKSKLVTADLMNICMMLEMKKFFFFGLWLCRTNRWTGSEAQILQGLQGLLR